MPPKPKANKALSEPVVVYTAPWQGIEAGQPVKVVSERFRGRRGLRWTFLRHAKNVTTGATWVDVIDKDGKVVAVPVTDVVTVKVKRKYTRKNNA